MWVTFFEEIYYNKEKEKNMNKKKSIIFLTMCICIILNFASITTIDVKDRPITISDAGDIGIYNVDDCYNL